VGVPFTDAEPNCTENIFLTQVVNHPCPERLIGGTPYHIAGIP